MPQQETTRKPIRMLLIEDNKGDALLINRAFSQLDTPYEITVARTGEEALSVLDGVRSYDYILLDLNLPGINGHEVLQTIKSSERFKHIPVFVLSSSRAQEDVLGSYQAYASCYLVKPHNLDALCEITSSITNFWFSKVLLPDNVSWRPSV